MMIKRAGTDQVATSGPPPTLDWNRIDTVLLDMDGTLIDLNYDNHVWNNVLPERLTQHRHGTTNVSTERLQETKDELLSHMRSIYGSIEFYSLPYWQQRTGLEITALHQEFTHLLRYRPSAELFLQRLGQRGKTRVLATNAHRQSLAIKQAHCDINQHIDLCISSHDYGYPKEDPGFWQALHTAVGFDPERTLFIDDNDPVLNSAAEFGIAHLLTVVQPDSNRPAKSGLKYPAFNDFAEIMPEPQS